MNAWSWVQSTAQAQALELRQADLEAREESARQALRSFEEQQRRCALVSFAHSVRSLYCCHQQRHSLLVSAKAESSSCSVQFMSAIHEGRALGKGGSDEFAPLLACRAFTDVDARKQDLQLREDRVALEEAELASLEQSTKAGLKTAQKKVPCPPLILLLSKDAC